MGRLLLLYLFLFGGLVLAASPDEQILKRADSLAKSKDKTELFRAYNDYKNLYLRALMESNDALCRSALDGIVHSGKKLSIDVARYEKELVSLPTAEQRAGAAPVKILGRHHLEQVYWKDERIVLAFNKPLKAHQVNYFKLIDEKKNSYRYIFDIHASLQQKNHVLTHAGIKRIKLAQYDVKTLRLVIENNTALKIRFKREGELLLISTGVSAPQSSHVASKSVLSRKVIVLDPGHGGRDSGAVGYGKYREKAITLQIAKKLRDIIKANGHTVYMTRTRDTYLQLKERTAYANHKNADLFISIHANAVPKKKDFDRTHGIEIYFLSPARSERAENVAAMENSVEIEEMNRYGKESFLNFLNREKIIASNKLAIDLQQGALGTLRKHYPNVKDKGVRKGPFWVLVGAQMPAVLVEAGFITNPTEAKRMANSTYQKRFAQGIAEGIERYFAKNP